MPYFKTILLDYDGTICETRPAILSALKTAFSHMGCPIEDASFLERQLGRGGTLHEFYYSLHSEASSQEADKFVSFYREAYWDADEKESFLFPDIEEILEKLVSHSCELLVVSNKHAQTLEKSLQRFRLEKFIKATYGSYEGVARKPSSDVWHKRLLKDFMHLKKEETLIVGDTVADLGFANAIGIKSCWADYGHGIKEQCLALKPDYRISSFRELPLLLEI